VCTHSFCKCLEDIRPSWTDYDEVLKPLKSASFEIRILSSVHSSKIFSFGRGKIGREIMYEPSVSGLNWNRRPLVGHSWALRTVQWT